MDAGIQGILIGGASSIATVIAAEIAKRSGSVTSAKVKAETDFLASITSELNKRTEQYAECEEERRKQDRRLRQMEYIIAQVAAEANTVSDIAEDVAREAKVDDLKTESRRLLFCAQRLRQLARRPEDDPEIAKMIGEADP